MPADGNFKEATKAYAKAASLVETPPNPWTTYDELTPEQRERFGGWVKTRDLVRKAAAHSEVNRKRTEDALRQAGGDKAKAFSILLGAQ